MYAKDLGTYKNQRLFLKHYPWVPTKGWKVKWRYDFMGKYWTGIIFTYLSEPCG